MGRQALIISMSLNLLPLAFIGSVSAHGGVVYPPIWQAGASIPLDEIVNDVAQEWADYLMAVDGFEHRHPNKYGENLYMSSGRAAQEQAQGAVDSWYSEIKDYTFGREPSRGGPVT